tara:strand:+ start:53 stop:376 length:324 start_codon:yes stop_codon:yes gene_type:complete
MGGMDKVEKYALGPIFSNTLGEHGMDVFGINADQEKEKAKKAAKHSTKEKKDIEVETPSARKADINESLLAKQGANRRRQLLQQSTGQVPQGPTLRKKQQSRNLLGG